MTDLHWYDMDGKPMTIGEWSKKYSMSPVGAKSRRVAETKTANGYRVSTVLLGLDHDFTGNGPPLIFETMVFKDNMSDLDCRRYATKAAAEAGHKEMVKTWESMSQPPEGDFKSQMATDIEDGGLSAVVDTTLELISEAVSDAISPSTGSDDWSGGGGDFNGGGASGDF
jgi:hypothetical protein